MPRDKVVTVFPTYGYRTGGEWTIPIRVWVHKARRIDALSDRLIRALFDDDSGEAGLSEQEILRCRECVADFRNSPESDRCQSPDRRA